MQRRQKSDVALDSAKNSAGSYLSSSSVHVEYSHAQSYGSERTLFGALFRTGLDAPACNFVVNVVESSCTCRTHCDRSPVIVELL
jgi:hypothetical protein